MNQPEQYRPGQAEMLAVVLKHHGPVVAEEQLAKIAEEGGDAALVRATAGLSGPEIAELTSRSDIVRPSLIHGLITPEKFVEVFRRVGTGWKAVIGESCSADTIREFQDELMQFFCAHILLTDELKPRIELMKAILAEEHGLKSLVFAVAPEKGFREFIANDGKALSPGDWQEVIEIVSAYLPDKWLQFKHLADDILEQEDYHDFCQEVAAEIYHVAATASGVVAEDKPPVEDSELFKPLPS
jgi:hypothetical protein